MPPRPPRRGPMGGPPPRPPRGCGCGCLPVLILGIMGIFMMLGK